MAAPTGASMLRSPVTIAIAAAGVLAPLLHSLQFLGDLGAHEVIDGDAIHIYQQVGQQCGPCSALTAALQLMVSSVSAAAKLAW